MKKVETCPKKCPCACDEATKCNVPVLLPPKLQRRGLVFSGKCVTVTVTVTVTVFGGYPYDGASAGIWVIHTYRWQIWG